MVSRRDWEPHNRIKYPVSSSLRKKKKNQKKVKTPVYITSATTRRSRLLKRTMCIPGKLHELAKIVGNDDLDFLLMIATRDACKPQEGYNFFTSNSSESPIETLELWKRRLRLDALRKKHQIEYIKGLENKKFHTGFFSFPHKSIIPDTNSRGYRDDASDDEDLWSHMSDPRPPENNDSRTNEQNHLLPTSSYDDEQSMTHVDQDPDQQIQIDHTHDYNYNVINSVESPTPPQPSSSKVLGPNSPDMNENNIVQITASYAITTKNKITPDSSNEAMSEEQDRPRQGVSLVFTPEQSASVLRNILKILEKKS